MEYGCKISNVVPKTFHYFDFVENRVYDKVERAWFHDRRRGNKLCYVRFLNKQTKEWSRWSLLWTGYSETQWQPVKAYEHTWDKVSAIIHGKFFIR